MRPWTHHLAPARSPRLLVELRRQVLYWKLQHLALRLSTQISPNAVPAGKKDIATSPNAAPATNSDIPTSPNSSRYCTCHAKWLSWLILLTYETSFTSGATSLTLRCHQILRLPRKIAFQNRVRICWKRMKVIDIAGPIRTWSDHDPTMNSSSRTRPFAEVTCQASEIGFVVKITTFGAPAIYPNFTKCCTCHEKWHSNITKCCAYHEKWHSKFTKFIQILHLPRKMTLMIDPAHIWNIIYKRSNKSHPPMSPNTAPATQNSTPKSKRNLLKTGETSLTLRGRFEHDRTMNWSSRTRPFAEVTCRALETGFVLKITPFGAPAIYPNFAKCCACHEKWPATRSDPVNWLNCYFTFSELLLHCHFTELYLTELLLYWTVTLLSRYFTELLLYRTVLDWAVPLLNCCFTELLLYWALTLLSCYFTELLLCWAVTLLNCYFTELLLYWILCIFKSP